ncbi:MAG: hypothetical protein AMXMBFR80_04080 [Dehalococcoidia bacterium]|jgi:hypothetical protein|nr:hypothetical protein [Tepidiformaceae bacterium]
MLDQDFRLQPPLLRRVLRADVAVEALIGLALLGTATLADRWFDVSTGVLYLLAAIFLIAAVAIVPLARAEAPSRLQVTGLAWANIAGGVVGWLVLLVRWDYFEPEGRWLLLFAADAFLALGAAELIALRRAP